MVVWCGLQGGVEGVGHCVFGWEVCVGFVRGGEESALQFVVVGPSCGVEVRVEDGVALELLFQMWSRPGWHGRSDLQNNCHI